VGGSGASATFFISNRSSRALAPRSLRTWQPTARAQSASGSSATLGTTKQR
jgi:hypothetical protein